MALFLLFRIGSDYYALDSAEVAEVLPLTATKQIPGAPAWVSGLMTRRGQTVPVIDVTALATGVQAGGRTSTRTVLVHYRRPGAGEAATHLLGLRLEYATDILRCAPESFVDSGIDPGPARYLGPVRQDARGLVQWVHVANLLPDAVHNLLFPEANPA
ncbi:chemotaxis protein CheW [Cupriavidus pauculus]|uniref:Chemotaxis protein CheW n=1 Tax=Cupriavidus pauculus TaxID=82633 RepID=A0A2N5C376_9BURK|nr:chemotaxis protein CheW [Cupriavidus pauculus]PLP96664.1 chemotaxis protein CheW [Cupriavidus pauculus]